MDVPFHGYYPQVNFVNRCIFAEYEYDNRRTSCSPIKNSPFGMYCENHARDLLNISAVVHTIKPNTHNIKYKILQLHFTSLIQNGEFLPFPFKLENAGDPSKHKFCIQEDKLKGNTYTNKNLIPILSTIASDGVIQDMVLYNSQFQPMEVAASLLQYKMSRGTLLETRMIDYQIAVETEDEIVMVDLKKFPFFYKHLFRMMGMSTYIERDDTKVKVMVPNLLVSTKDFRVSVINRDEDNIILIDDDDTTLATPIVLSGQKTVEKLGLETLLSYEPHLNPSLPTACRV